MKYWQRHQETLGTVWFPGLLVIISWFPMRGEMQVITPGILSLAVIILLITRSVRLARGDLIWGAVFFGWATVYSALHTDTGILNPLVGLITYSGLIVFIIRGKEFPRTIKNLLVLLGVISAIEGGLGILQVVSDQNGQILFQSAAAGDRAVGTTLVETNSNIFAAKMFFQVLVLLYGWMYARWHESWMTPKAQIVLLVGIVVGTLGIVFASPLAFIYISFVTIVGTYVLYGGWQWLHRQRMRFNEFSVLMIWMISILVLTWFIQPGNATMTSLYVDEIKGGSVVFNPGERPPNSDVANERLSTLKIDIFREVVETDLLASPQTALLGYGLGRHSSRAAMILSGSYLMYHPSWVPISMSDEMAVLLENHWTEEIQDYYHGTHLALPASSIQAVLLEFGLLGTMGLLGYVGSLLYRIVKRARLSDDAFQRFMLARLPLILLVYAAVSFYFFWLEYPPVLSFIGVLLAVCLVSESDQSSVPGE